MLSIEIQSAGSINATHALAIEKNWAAQSAGIELDIAVRGVQQCTDEGCVVASLEVDAVGGNDVGS